MTWVRCRITLAVGCYGRTPTASAVRSILRWVLSDSLDALEFPDSQDEDIALEADATVFMESQFRDWGHDEIVRDRISTALVEHLRPEYESMVEVEVTEVDGELFP